MHCWSISLPKSNVSQGKLSEHEPVRAQSVKKDSNEAWACHSLMSQTTHHWSKSLSHPKTWTDTSLWHQPVWAYSVKRRTMAATRPQSSRETLLFHAPSEHEASQELTRSVRLLWKVSLLLDGSIFLLQKIVPRHRFNKLWRFLSDFRVSKMSMYLMSVYGIQRPWQQKSDSQYTAPQSRYILQQEVLQHASPYHQYIPQQELSQNASYHIISTPLYRKRVSTSHTISWIHHTTETESAHPTNIQFTYSTPHQQMKSVHSKDNGTSVQDLFDKSGAIFFNVKRATLTC